MKAELRNDRTFLTGYYSSGALGLTPLLGLLEVLQPPKTLTSFPALLCMAICVCVVTFFSLRWFQKYAKFASFAYKGTQREGEAMSVAFEHITGIGEQVSQIEEKNRVSFEHLEQISRLEKHIQSSPESALISDEITYIQCLVDKANEITNNKKFYLLLKQVEQAIDEIKKFHLRHHEPLPDKVFSDLKNNLATHRKSIESIKRGIKLLEVKEPKNLLRTVRGLENFASALEGNLEFLPYYIIYDLDEKIRELVEKIKQEGIQLAKGKGTPFVPGIKKLEGRIISSLESIVVSTGKAKAFVLSTQSAEAKAIERIESLDSVEWETVREPGQEINIDKINERLKKRGYSIQLSRTESSSN